MLGEAVNLACQADFLMPRAGLAIRQPGCFRRLGSPLIHWAPIWQPPERAERREMKEEREE